MMDMRFFYQYICIMQLSLKSEVFERLSYFVDICIKPGLRISYLGISMDGKLIYLFFLPYSPRAEMLPASYHWICHRFSGHRN